MESTKEDVKAVEPAVSGRVGAPRSVLRAPRLRRYLNVGPGLFVVDTTPGFRLPPNLREVCAVVVGLMVISTGILFLGSHLCHGMPVRFEHGRYILHRGHARAEIDQTLGAFLYYNTFIAFMLMAAAAVMSALLSRGERPRVVPPIRTRVVLVPMWIGAIPWIALWFVIAGWLLGLR